MKPYTSKSLTNAIREVRVLRRQYAEVYELLQKLDAERQALARLAAEGPAFFNPLDIWAAKNLRDELLRRQGMAPDGKFLSAKGPVKS